MARWQASGNDPRFVEANKILADNLESSLRVVDVFIKMGKFLEPVTEKLALAAKRNREDYAPGGIIEVRDLVRSDLSRARTLISI